MKSPDNTSSVVLVGNWNPFILNPQWVGKYIFKKKQIEAEFLFGPKLAFRFSAFGARIVPTQDKVTIIADECDKRSLGVIERLSRELLSELPHTPIHAIGVNHAFIEDSPGEDILSLFNFPDERKFPNDMPIESTEITRRLAGDGHGVNLKISIGQGFEGVRFDFNFHYPIGGNLKELDGDIIKKGGVLGHFEFARDFLAAQYGLDYEEKHKTEESDGSVD